MYIYTYHYILLCKLCKFSLLFIYPCLDKKVLTSNKVDVDVDRFSVMLIGSLWMSREFQKFSTHPNGSVLFLSGESPSTYG